MYFALAGVDAMPPMTILPEGVSVVGAHDEERVVESADLTEVRKQVFQLLVQVPNSAVILRCDHLGFEPGKFPPPSYGPS